MAPRASHFRFWILRRGSGHALDFRLSENESSHRTQDLLFILFAPVENRQSEIIGNLKSLDDFIRSRQHLLRNRQTDLLSGFEIDDELELLRLLDGQVGRLGTFQNLVNEVTGAPK